MLLAFVEMPCMASQELWYWNRYSNTKYFSIYLFCFNKKISDYHSFRDAMHGVSTETINQFNLTVNRQMSSYI